MSPHKPRSVPWTPWLVAALLCAVVGPLASTRLLPALAGTGEDLGRPINAAAASALVRDRGGEQSGSQAPAERAPAAPDQPTPPFPTLVPTEPLPTLPPSVPTPAPFTPTATADRSETPRPTEVTPTVVTPSPTPGTATPTSFLGLSRTIWLPVVDLFFVPEGFELPTAEATPEGTVGPAPTGSAEPTGSPAPTSEPAPVGAAEPADAEVFVEVSAKVFGARPSRR